VYNEQLVLEQQMRTAGMTRTRERNIAAVQSCRVVETDPGAALRKSAVAPVADAIAGFRRDRESTRGPKHVFLKQTEEMEPEAIALITLKVALNGMARKRMFTKVAYEVGRALEDEARFRHYRTENKALFETLAADLRARPTSWAYQRRLVINRMNKAKVTFEVWPERHRLHVGVKALDLLMQATGMFTSSLECTRRKRYRQFIATPETWEWLNKAYDKDAILHPIYEPMIVPPKDWTTPWNGGYLSMRSLPLVKTHNRQYLESLLSADLDDVYAAINHVQRVGWRVNRRVYEVERALWEQGDEDAGLPRGTDLEVPARVGFRPDVPAERLSEPERAALTAWKRAAAAVHRANREEMSKRIAQSQALVVAGKFIDREQFYFPHQLDWRGRMYPIPQALHPQSNDAGRALLEFADGKPLGETGAVALALHGASCFGYDKVSLAEMARWVKQHEKQVLACAYDPLGQRWWTEADKPFQFLAFCFEWEGYVREGDAFISHLPCALDGTCNGLQHFCMLLGDEAGAAHVNLLPSDEPSDVYQTVADKVVEKLKWLEAHLEPMDPDLTLARMWLAFGIDRKVVKRPVMTLPYGATRFGFTEQIMVDTLRPARSGSADFPFEGDGHAAARFLAGLIWSAIGSVVPAAIQCMEFLQETAKIIAGEGKAMRWTAPSGLPVHQRYTKLRAVRVESNLANRRITLDFIEPTNRLDKNRQKMGVAPNFIHALDASHLMRTVGLLIEHVEDVSFAGVHDSFATHACNVETLLACIGRAMVEQYEDRDVLIKWHREVSELTEATLPDPPAWMGMNPAVAETADFFR
jgi:DNA-directed RNA polymerase